MENYEEKKNGTVSTVVSYLIVIVMTILIGITFVKTTISDKINIREQIIFINSIS